MSTEDVVVRDWPRPKGYANGRIGRGRAVHVAGQIGWDEQRRFVEGGFVPQFAKALDNVIAVVRSAGGNIDDIAAMTIYVTNLHEYRGHQKELGDMWRDRMRTHFPAMALVEVSGLVEEEAEVEIQAVAYVGEAP